LDGSGVVSRADYGQRSVERDRSLLDSFHQSLLALLKQSQDALNVFVRKPCLGGNLLGVVAAGPQFLDTGEQFQRSTLPASYVLAQAHDECVLVAGGHHQRRYLTFAQCAKSGEPPFTANQQVVVGSIGLRPGGDNDRLLQANRLDVGDDLGEGPPVSLARVENLDLRNW